MSTRSHSAKSFAVLARLSILDSFLKILPTFIRMARFVVICFYGKHVITFWVLVIGKYLAFWAGLAYEFVVLESGKKVSKTSSKRETFIIK